MNIFKQLVLVFVLCSLFSCVSKTKPITKPINYPPLLVRVTGEYVEINDVKDLPLVLTRYFNKDRFGAEMVNPESYFNGSRGTQLKSAGNAGDVWFIEYFSGGAALSRWFAAFRIKDNVIYSLTTIYPVDRTFHISIDELANRLPNKAGCITKKENWVQYTFETSFGLCPFE